MKSSVAPLEGNKVKLSVEVDEAEFDKALDAAFRKIAREVRIPGFRPGRAPRRLLEARLGAGAGREQALRDAIPGYLAEAVREHDVDVIATPQVDITAGEEDGPITFDATVEVRPTVTVPGYGGLRVEVPSPYADDDEVEQRIQAQLRPHGELADVDRPAATGDYVTLDLAAERDGEPVAGLNTEDWLYEIGREWVTPTLDERLSGATVGDSFEFSAAPSGTEDEADFTVTVKKVQELVLPELTDDWVQENLDDVESADEWRAQQRAQLDAMHLVQARQQLVDRTALALAELVDQDVPEVMVNQEVTERARTMIGRLQQQGITLEQWLGATGQDPQAFTDSLRSEATNAVKVDLALRAVAEAELLEPIDEDIEAEYARIARQVNEKPARVRQAYERNDAVGGLRAELRKRAAMDWLLANVEVVDPDGKSIDGGMLIVAGHDHEHDHQGDEHEGHDHEGHDHSHDREGHDHAGEPINEETHA